MQLCSQAGAWEQEKSLFRVFARNEVTKQSTLFQYVASIEIASLRSQ